MSLSVGFNPAHGGAGNPPRSSFEEISGLGGLPQTVPATLPTRQREAIETALSKGYYEIPRTASHEDVAAALGCAPSTAAEHLRKAEAKLIETVLSR